MPNDFLLCYCKANTFPLSKETMSCSFIRAGAECLCATDLPLVHHSNKNNIIRCNSESPSQFRLKRRHMLLASTSVRLPAPEFILNSNDEVSSLSDYHKLQNAQKLKFKYASNIDMASLFCSSDSCKGSPDEFSGMVSVPSQQYYGGNYDFVQAKVGRPAYKEQYGDLEENLIIEGIKVRRDRPLWFDVYLRPCGREEDDEYAGSFIHLPPPQKKPLSHKVSSCCLRLGVGHMFHDFDAQQAHERSVIVTLVPKFNNNRDPIRVDNISLQYT